ncbi:MAG: (Fe-S)-binding protein [Candidatus Helarchaeota archaeon]
MSLYDKIDREKILNSAMSCVHCAMCRQVLPSMTKSNAFADICPSGLYFNYDAYYSTGRNEIARAIIREEYPLEESDLLNEIIYSCTTCGACEINCRYICDTNVLPVHTTETIRAILVKKGIGPLPNQKKFAEHVKNVNNPYGESGKRNNWVEDTSVIDRKKAKILYFVGCTTGYRLTNVAHATIKILNFLKEDFTISSHEVCCGSPLIRTGQLDDVERLINENLEMIKNSGAKTLIFSCAGCYRTVSKDWPNIIGHKLPFKTLHIAEYLAQKVKKKKLRFNKELNMKIAYHDPCHLGRHMFPNQIYDQPRYIIDSIPGIQRILLEREMDSTLCCGAGGGVKSGMPDYSEYIATLRIEEIRACGAETVITPCPFCIRGLSDGAKKEADSSKLNPIKVMGLTELILKALEV